MVCRRAVSALSFLLLSTTAISVRADDWPGWMGPFRDNVWRESGILDRFPDDGATILWRRPIAGGYAGPAVADGCVYVFDFQLDTPNDDAPDKPRAMTGVERLHCFDAVTGKTRWVYDYAVTYKLAYPCGPRCTPLVADGRVYLLGAMGRLTCLDAAGGKPIWSKELPAAYDANVPTWGYAAHPLLDGKQLIVLAGGDGSHVVALDKSSGEEIWHSQSQPEPGYAPPVIVEAGGRRQLIVAGPRAVRGLDPATGKRFWSQPYDATSGCVIMQPMKIGDYLFVGGHEMKSLLLKFDAKTPTVTEVWKDKRGHAISPINVQPVADGLTVYGFNEGGEFLAFDLVSGKRLWSTAQPLGDETLWSGTCHIVRQDDRHWLFAETGELILGRLSPDGFTQLARAKVIEPTGKTHGRHVAWAPPAFANRKCYVRNDKEIIGVDLAK
jgi:outer membrane protein assembly factor BamB